MNIAVAGAGHGGLVAAARLSRAGHRVTVYEQQERDALGHDWEDRFTFSLLEEITGKPLPEGSWRFRGDCAFVSPSYRTEVVIRYTDENRQKIMWRKALIGALLEHAEENGVTFCFGTAIRGPLVQNGAVTGLVTDDGEIPADLVIDAAGAFSPVRCGLPASYHIEKEPKRGEVFYAWRAYLNKTEAVNPEVPFEIFLCHDKEQGLSWCCTNGNNADILVGLIDPLTDEKIEQSVASFRKRHPYIGTEILSGGQRGIIPVRRPLALMVGQGYAAVGDSAFMTTPMNGMGIDLSLQAGRLLADTLIKNGNCDLQTLWCYNRDYHRSLGGVAAKNEGLKNSLLQMPGEGVDFLFDNGVIQSSDLAGAGQKTSLGSLLGKFVRGMRSPGYFFAIIKGLMKGAKLAGKLKKAPERYDEAAVLRWQQQVTENVLWVTRHG